ncbi:methylated-DNA-[protein]-cysteine S-methyltransferase [Alicyclobacillus vulcanalis]|uniref:Methylated-DNA--protein-cysteine methyltransferase n=1 Tax=Alicyclobacillus vulcanalis TaxID=252246 RepID=A0A1N7NXM6_9BACL|nr:methylated-DNA-[protein]-cysteine S-methyltransferase [Alicyclobacillus vulcanalis]
MGDMWLAAEPQGVVASGWTRLEPAPGERERTMGGDALEVAEWAAAELRRYFAGELRSFSVPLAPRGTAFQRAVWDALRSIPFGERVAYRDIAAAVGRPQAVRAVGQANRANPLPVFIPCHRVVGADGRLVGYAGANVDLKAWLLHHEANVLRAQAMA